MSLEQAILLVLFVLIPLAQAIAGARKRRHASPRPARVPRAPTPAEREVEDWLAQAAQARPNDAPLFSAEVREPPRQPAVRAAPAPRPSPKAPADGRRAQRLRKLPSSRAGLRDALVLAAILGPPRALDRSER